MCRFGMKEVDDNGEVKAVKKPTKFMTSAEELAGELGRRCRQYHEHTHTHT